MNTNIINMRQSMEQAGIYSEDDINEICRLEEEYTDECERIAEECESEGYPSHGSNYNLRCEQVRKYYDEQIALIDSKYDIEED
jgi:hypothetical protein